ncbi:MAG: DEAD/DEAH box helicase [Candidatus Heimdallarchaeota archaeon]
MGLETSINNEKRLLLRTEKIEERDYQVQIAKKCILKNSLVVIPTGLGKTVIGVYVAAKTLERFQPESKIIVLAPTRPLINQHYDSFKDLLNIDEEKFFVLTGKTAPEKRAQYYRDHQIIFYTPQTLRNDLVHKRYTIENVVLIVFDEAHHATGEYAYCLIADEYLDQNPDGNILGLTASPGSSKEKIRTLCTNLHISHENIYTRTRRDLDVKKYLQPLDVYKIGVNLSELMEDAYYVIKQLLEERLQYLSQYSFLETQGETLHEKVIRKDLLRLNSELVKLVKGDGDKTGVYSALSVNAQGLILYHMLELIEQQGLDVLFIYLEKLKKEALKKNSSKASKILASDYRLTRIFIELKKHQDFSPEQLIHPKYIFLEQILAEELKNNSDSRILVFVKLRDSVKNIVKKLKQSTISSLKPARFVGQTTKSEDDKGLSQKKQLEILDKFKKGELNVLVSTNVGEEGLDIAECDLVVFYDVVASEIRFIQRRGRTGRHRKGKVIILYCRDTHDEVYMKIALNKLRKMNVNLKDKKELTHAYHPILSKILPSIPTEVEEKQEPENNSTRNDKRENQEPQRGLMSFIYKTPDKKKEIYDIEISQFFPVKFGIRKWLSDNGIKFDTNDSKSHIVMFGKLLIQVYVPRPFNNDWEQSLLVTIENHKKNFQLTIVIFDFVDFEEQFSGEERLLKKKINEFGNKKDLQVIMIDNPEELYFIIKNIYEHHKQKE